MLLYHKSYIFSTIDQSNKYKAKNIIPSGGAKKMNTAANQNNAVLLPLEPYRCIYFTSLQTLEQIISHLEKSVKIRGVKSCFPKPPQIFTPKLFCDII